MTCSVVSCVLRIRFSSFLSATICDALIWSAGLDERTSCRRVSKRRTSYRTPDRSVVVAVCGSCWTYGTCGESRARGFVRGEKMTVVSRGNSRQRCTSRHLSPRARATRPLSPSRQTAPLRSPSAPSPLPSAHPVPGTALLRPARPSSTSRATLRVSSGSKGRRNGTPRGTRVR